MVARVKVSRGFAAILNRPVLITDSDTRTPHPSLRLSSHSLRPLVNHLSAQILSRWVALTD